MSKLILQKIIRELHSSMVSYYTDGGIKDSRERDNNIIVIDSILRNILPHQLKNMTSIYKIMCGCEFWMSAKSMHPSLLSWWDNLLKKFKDKSCNEKNRRPGEMANHVYVTYKNSVMPRGKHMFQTASDMAMEIMFSYP